MKYYIEFFKNIPKELLEAISFFVTVLFGAVYKIIRQKQEKGMKITLSKICTETFMSFFIALVVYAIFDQFLHCNKLFTYVMASLAGSMSSMFHAKIEELFSYIFDVAKKRIDQLFKVKSNETN